MFIGTFCVLCFPTTRCFRTCGRCRLIRGLSASTRTLFWTVIVFRWWLGASRGFKVRTSQGREFKLLIFWVQICVFLFYPVFWRSNRVVPLTKKVCFEIPRWGYLPDNLHFCHFRCGADQSLDLLRWHAVQLKPLVFEHYWTIVKYNYTYVHLYIYISIHTVRTIYQYVNLGQLDKLNFQTSLFNVNVQPSNKSDFPRQVQRWKWPSRKPTRIRTPKAKSSLDFWRFFEAIL